MKKFLVGGAVRDTLMDLPCNDRDYVVVGSTEQEMLNAGFKKAGAFFPVFLHPETGEEYALARREKKTGVGYNGFSVEFDPSVTLEEDLVRRDLTINSMAKDLDTGALFDPFNGQEDLLNKVLRHTSTAFAEDPLRVVRLARFAARFSDFTIAPSTIELAKTLLSEMNTLSDERFMAEINKTFRQASDPNKFFNILMSIGVLDNVAFFKDLFGSINWMASSQYTFPSVFVVPAILKHIHLLPLDARVPTFIALIAADDAKQKSVAISLRIKELTQHLRTISIIDCTPENVLWLLYSVRGFSKDSTELANLIKAVEFTEQIGFRFNTSAKTLLNAALNARQVSAALFPGIEGAALGEAIAAERLKMITESMK